MIKYRYTTDSDLWGVYGLRVVPINDELFVMIVDLHENLGAPLEETFTAVATEVVQLLMSQQLVDDPAGVQWMYARQRDPKADPVDWKNMYLDWHDNRYWIAPLMPR